MITAWRNWKTKKQLFALRESGALPGAPPVAGEDAGALLDVAAQGELGELLHAVRLLRGDAEQALGVGEQLELRQLLCDAEGDYKDRAAVYKICTLSRCL